MFELRCADNRHRETAQHQQRLPKTDEQCRTGHQLDIGGNEGRGVNQPKARHSQHAVNEIGDEVAAEIALHLAVERGLARGYLFPLRGRSGNMVGRRLSNR